MTSYEDKLKSYTEFLRKALVDVFPDDVLENISDEELMAAGRKNPETGKDFFSEEQERHIIMENSSNDSIAEAFNNIKHLCHLEEKEKLILREFSDKSKVISVKNDTNVQALLKKLKKYAKNVKLEDIDETLKLVCSVYPGWVLDGLSYRIIEDEPLQFSLAEEEGCVGCLLEDSLHDYVTFYGWATNNYTGEIYNNEEFDEDIEPEVIETYDMKAKDALVDMLTALFNLKYENPDSFFEDIGEDGKYNDIFFELCEVLWRYLMVVPLISCWVYGKDLAQRARDQRQEAIEILNGLHEQLDIVYQECQKSKNYASFLQGIKNYLHQFDKDQLLLISRFGLPFDMTRTLENKVDKILIKEIHTKITAEDKLS